MRLLVDLNDEVYNNMVVKNEYTDIDVIAVHNALMGAIRIPEGHGRLIDADELKTLSYEVLVDTENPNRADGLSVCNGIVEEDIDLAPTIIEADKEGEQE